MGEQATTHEIETAVRKRERQGVRNHRTMSALQMGRSAVQVGYVEGDPFIGQLLARHSGDFAISRGDFQDGEPLLSADRRYSLDEFPGGGDAAKPAIDAAKIAKRDFDLRVRASF